MSTDPFTVADEPHRAPAARTFTAVPVPPTAPSQGSGAPEMPSLPASPPTAEEMAFGAPKPEPVVARERPKARQIVFKRREEREKRFDLSAPFEVDGVEWDHVTLRRMNTADMMAFIDVLQATEDATALRWPIYYGPDGEPIPEDVWQAMDPDDTDKVSAAGADFLPSRFRPKTSDANQATTTSATPGGSENTGSSSG